MKAADLQVKTALIRAGYEGRPMDCRGALYETLEQLLREDPQGNDDLVGWLRSVLSEADECECRAELEAVRQQLTYIKGCPECGFKPDVGLGYVTDTGEVLVVCMNHVGYAVAQGGRTLMKAVEFWNDDRWTGGTGGVNCRRHFLL